MCPLRHSNLCDELSMVFKSATWLMFNFVGVHPFGDGNGHPCCLVANYALHGHRHSLPCANLPAVGEAPGQIKREDY